MNPIMNQSGKFAGRVTISRKGNRRLRQTMIQTTQLVVNNVGYFTAAYNRLIIEGQKEPNVAIVAIANKLIKVLMKMIHSNEKFNPPTAQDQSLCTQKIKRLTSKKTERTQKRKETRLIDQKYSVLNAGLKSKSHSKQLNYNTI